MGVVGPAGSGKTTTVAAWAQQFDEPVIWRRERDGDLSAVLRESAPLVVDDLPPADQMQRWEAELTARQERGAATVLVSREEPLTDWQYRLGQGSAATFGFEEFLLTADEVAENAARLGLDPDSDRAAEIQQLTAGWPTLVSLLLAAADTRPDAISASDAHSYLRSQVLDPLPTKERRFLSALAHLRRFDADLAEVALDDVHAGAKIDGLWRRRSLLLPDQVRSGYYCFPPIVAELLRRDSCRPPREMLATIHHAASLEHERRGEWEDAVSHMVRANQEHAVRQLIRMMRAQEPLGRSEEALAWFGRLPRNIRLRPSSVLGLVKALIHAGLAPEAEQLLDRATPDRWDRQDHVVEYHVLRSFVLRMQFRHEEAITSANAALIRIEAGLKCSPARTAYLRLYATDQIAEVLAWEGDVATVAVLAAATAPDTTLSGEQLNLVHAIARDAVVALDGGDVLRAEEQARAALRMAERRSFDQTHLTSEARLVLGSVAAERDEHDSALEHLSSALDLALQGLFPTTVVRCRMKLAEILARVGRAGEAADQAERIAALAREVPDPVLRARSVAVSGRLALHRQDLAAAAAAERRLHGVPQPADVRHIRLVLGLRSQSAADIGLPLDDGDGTSLDRVTQAVLLAHHQHRRDPVLASARLTEALRLAETSGLRRTLLDLADGLADLGPEVLGNADATLGPSTAYVRWVFAELHEMARRRSPLLSPREAEVAGYLGTRLTNSQIAAELFISENTAKTHLRHIYQKLGVERRDRAVPLLQELGYIPLEP